MQALDKHIILIGFKHVGKSVIGEQLAIKIEKPFIDLDRQIEYLFSQKFKKKLLSRQIMQDYGEDFFRALENEALIKTLSAIPLEPQAAKLAPQQVRGEFTRDLNDSEWKNSKEYSLYFESFPTQNHLKVDVKSDAQLRSLRSERYIPSVIAVGGGSPLALENQALLKSHLLIYIKAPYDIVFKRIMANGQPAFFSSEEDPYEAFKKLWEKREKIYQTLADFSVNNADSVEQAVLQIIEILNRL